MSLFLAYTPFKNSNIDKLHVACQVRSMSARGKEIKARACQAHLIINIRVERLGGGIELSSVFIRVSPQPRASRGTLRNATGVFKGKKRERSLSIGWRVGVGPR